MSVSVLAVYVTLTVWPGTLMHAQADVMRESG